MLRRIILLAVILCLPAFAAAPALAAHSSAAHKPAAHRKCVPATKKGTKHKAKATRCKPARGKHRGKSTAKPKRKPTAKPKATAKPKSPAKPKVTATPKKPHTATPVIALPPATSTPTSTPTPTPTLTPTSTATPTPLPQAINFPLSASVPFGTQAAFYVCGLPAGASATVAPAVATSAFPSGSSQAPVATSLLTVVVPPVIVPAQYSLAVHAWLIDPSGGRTVASPDELSPHALTLTVDNQHEASLTAEDGDVAVGDTGCSAIPNGFAPTPTPTPSPADVSVSVQLSDTHPGPGEVVVLTGHVTLQGQPLPNVGMHSVWYFPFAAESCDGVTDATGTAVCAEVNSSPIPGRTVPITIDFNYNGHDYTASTSFTQ